MDIVNSNIALGCELACQKLIETASDRWRKEEGDYRDDVSLIMSYVAIF